MDAVLNRARDSNGNPFLNSCLREHQSPIQKRLQWIARCRCAINSNEISIEKSQRHAPKTFNMKL